MKIIINGLNKYGEEFEWGETVKNHTQVSKTHTHTHTHSLSLTYVS